MAGQNREVEFDLIRTLIIFSALILHYDIKADIGIFAAPSLLFEKYFFTMGGFFFFTSGYMARKIYLERFKKAPAAASKSMILKGLGILALYLSYVFFMHILTASEMPENVTAFIFDHKFFTKALFTFSILITLTPLFLWIYAKSSKAFFILTVCVGMAIIAYNPQSAMPEDVKKIFFDRDLFLNPLLPSLFVFSAGFFIAGLNSRFTLPRTAAFWAMGLLIGHVLLLQTVEAYSKIVFNRNLFTFWEGITPFLFIIIFREIISHEGIKKIALHPYVLCIGIYSLHFYFISNLLLGLSSITRKSEISVKMGGFAVILILAYLFTYWRMQANSQLQRSQPV